MTVQKSVGLRNAQLDAAETYVGTAPILTLRTGSAPANCAQANTGSLIATITLPSDWMAAASGGVKSKSGTWSNSAAGGTGTVAHFRIHNSAGSECCYQGSVSNTGGGGDMIMDNTSVNAGQQVTISTCDMTAGNA